MKKFKIIYLYKEDEGKMIRHVIDSVYHVIRLVNMYEATGDFNQDEYNVELHEIDLTNVSNRNLDSALSYAGLSDRQMDALTDEMKVESLSDYGLFAPMGSWSGNNYLNLLKKAKNESYKLEDKSYHEERMKRSCNKLGSTAKECQAGDYISAMIRGIQTGDKSARIMGKIHGLTENNLNEIQAS